MRCRVRAKQRERDVLYDFIVQNVATIANRADLVQFSNAIAVFIDADIRFNVENLVRRLVVAQRQAKERLIGRITGDHFVVHLETASSGVFFNDLTRITHRNQLRNRGKLAATNVNRVLDSRCFVVDQKLLWRDALNDETRCHNLTTDAHGDAGLTRHHVRRLFEHINLNG